MQSSASDENLEQQAAPQVKSRKSVLRSFHFAWEGLAFCFATQKHMQVHFAIMGLVLLAAWGLQVSQSELLNLLMAMVLVLMSEMVNTAIEYSVDIYTDGYDPRAKVAKDIAAGAVLVAAVYSLIVGTLVFSTNDRLRAVLKGLPGKLETPQMDVVQVVVIGILVLSIIITWAKKRTQRGTLWRGGVISGHTAFGFFIAASIAIITRNLPVTFLAMALALLVSQSRIQARIHSPLEVLLGGLMGIFLAFVLFMWPS